MSGAQCASRRVVHLGTGVMPSIAAVAYGLSLPISALEPKMSDGGLDFVRLYNLALNSWRLKLEWVQNCIVRKPTAVGMYNALTYMLYCTHATTTTALNKFAHLRRVVHAPCTTNPIQYGLKQGLCFETPSASSYLHPTTTGALPINIPPTPPDTHHPRRFYPAGMNCPSNGEV
jgi:hypothetical protein